MIMIIDFDARFNKENSECLGFELAAPSRASSRSLSAVYKTVRHAANFVAYLSSLSPGGKRRINCVPSYKWKMATVC